MQFSQLWGNELDRELGSEDRTVLFTSDRRKAAINAAQLEWLKRTECLQRQVSIALVDGTQDYDLETSITDFGWIAKAGVTVKIVSGSNTRYIEGDDLIETSEERLNTEMPGWRAVSAGTPTHRYLKRNGGAVNLGFHPAPYISGSDVWTALVSAVVIPADMSVDADLPFTISSNAVASLRPWHRALVFYAAYDLEKFRKDAERGAMNLQAFENEVQSYETKQAPKSGQRVRLARDYRGDARGGRSSRLDPRVW